MKKYILTNKSLSLGTVRTSSETIVVGSEPVIINSAPVYVTSRIKVSEIEVPEDKPKKAQKIIEGDN